MIRFFKTPFFHRWIFHRRVWGFSNKSVVFLTFDDGPNAELTNWILDFLEGENIKATFFCVGENAKQYPELIDKMRQGGHSVGNHTMNHEKGIRTSKKKYLDSIEEASKYIQSDLFRPPYGRVWMRYTSQIRKKYKIIMWSWLSYDYDSAISIEKVLNKAERQIKGGEIIVLHDNIKTEDRLKILLPKLILLIREKNLKFDVIH